MWGAQCLLEVRRRVWGGSGRPSMLMLVRSAAALATMRPVLLLRVLKKAARRLMLLYCDVTPVLQPVVTSTWN